MDIKTQWAGALRSGEYTQGIGKLKSSNAEGETSHCCLGVLCELYDKAHIASREGLWMEVADIASGEGCATCLHDGENNYPSSAVLEWARYSQPSDCDFLVAANDGGKSFEEIADIIESSL